MVNTNSMLVRFSSNVFRSVVHHPEKKRTFLSWEMETLYSVLYSRVSFSPNKSRIRTASGQSSADVHPETVMEGSAKAVEVGMAVLLF